MASLLELHSAAEGKGRVWGGFVRSWLDEMWKTAVGVKASSASIAAQLLRQLILQDLLRFA